MKIAVLAVLCSASFAASAGVPERVQFVGTVQQDAAPPVSIVLDLPSSQAAALELADGSKLELTTAGSAATPDGARIRLLAPDGVVLHTATIPDKGMASTSFAYKVCAGKVTYISPAPVAVSACGS